MRADTSVSDFANQLSEEQREKVSLILDQYLVQCEQGSEPNLDQLCEKNFELAPAIRHYVQSLRILKGAACQVQGAPSKLIGDYRIVREIGRG